MKSLKERELSSNFFLKALFIGICSELVFKYLTSYNKAIPTGVVALIMTVISSAIYYKNKKIRKDIKQDDIVLYGDVSFIEKSFMNPNNGWLYLTKSHLIFVPNSPSSSKPVLTFSLLDLESLESCHVSSFSSAETMLKITTKNNNSNKIILTKPTVWVKTIKELVADLKKQKVKNAIAS